MASEETWNTLRHFARAERWGDPLLISDHLLLMVDGLRDHIGLPFVITEGVAYSGHSKKSFHYPENGACAVDLVIPEFNGTAIDLLLEVFRFGFTGVGYYNFWKYKGQSVHGLHLDTRPIKFNEKASRWIGIKNRNKVEYIDMDYSNLKIYGG